jgi:prophage tail gpP-like protein
MSKDPLIELKVNGSAFEGFVGGSAEITMESPFCSFSLDYVADGKSPGSRAIYEGDECELLIDAGAGKESLIYGFVENVADEDSKDGIVLGCSGSSKAVDLECSAVKSPGSWKKSGLKKIASDLADDFGISIVIDGDAGAPFENYSIQTGESAYDCVMRAATLRAMYGFSVGKDFVLAKAGNKSSGMTLERGKNIVRSGRTSSWKERFSEYTFRGQIRGTDGTAGKAASQNKATVKDATINRYRPMLLQYSADSGSLKARAQVEANQRAGRGEVIWALVDGWGTDGGHVWRANTTVGFKNSVLGVDATLLIVSASYGFGPNESRQTMLRMMRPEAFDIAAFPKAKRGASIT